MAGQSLTMSMARQEFKEAIKDYRLAIEESFYGAKSDGGILKARVIRLYRESPEKMRWELLYTTLRTLTKPSKPRNDSKTVQDSVGSAASLTIRMRDLADELLNELEKP
jgi:hypothetical protein